MLIFTSFIGQFVHPVGREGVKGGGWGINISDSCEKHFIRVHENLVQHPSNNISIVEKKINSNFVLETNVLTR